MSELKTEEMNTILEELYENKLGLEIDHIAVLAALITTPSIAHNIPKYDDIVEELVEQQIIILNDDNTIKTIDITLNDTDDVDLYDLKTQTANLLMTEWEFIEVNNVGFWSKIHNEQRFNLYPNQHGHWTLINTTNRDEEVHYFKTSYEAAIFVDNDGMYTTTVSLSG